MAEALDDAVYLFAVGAELHDFVAQLGGVPQDATEQDPELPRLQGIGKHLLHQVAQVATLWPRGNEGEDGEQIVLELVIPQVAFGESPILGELLRVDLVVRRLRPQQLRPCQIELVEGLAAAIQAAKQHITVVEVARGDLNHVAIGQRKSRELLDVALLGIVDVFGDPSDGVANAAASFAFLLDLLLFWDFRCPPPATGPI